MFLKFYLFIYFIMCVSVKGIFYSIILQNVTFELSETSSNK